MPKSETIRGLERGLRVLQALQSSSISPLHQIHLVTRISKPSLLRILNTLEHAGFISRRLADGHYRISVFARMERKRDRYDRVAEAAAPSSIGSAKTCAKRTVLSSYTRRTGTALVSALGGC